VAAPIPISACSNQGTLLLPEGGVGIDPAADDSALAKRSVGASQARQMELRTARDPVSD